MRYTVIILRRYSTFGDPAYLALPWLMKLYSKNVKFGDITTDKAGLECQLKMLFPDLRGD